MAAKKRAEKVSGKKSAGKVVTKKSAKKKAGSKKKSAAKAVKKKAATKKAAKKTAGKKKAAGKAVKKKVAKKAAKKTARAKASPGKPVTDPVEAEPAPTEVVSEKPRVGEIAIREPAAAPSLPFANQGSTRITSMDVSLGHVFTLRPRVSTAFPAEDFRSAKHQLRSEQFASIPEAARAVAERALEIANQGPHDFKNQ